MVRVLAYGVLGACVGCVGGVLVSAFANARDLTDIYAGAFFGLLIGIGAAAYVNRTSGTAEPFVTQSQIEGLTGLADWKLGQTMVPASLRDKMTSWLRSKLEG